MCHYFIFYNIMMLVGAAEKLCNYWEFEENDGKT